VELGAPAPVALAAALLLVFVLPGAALLLALPASVRPRERAPQVMLGFGMSIVLSMLSFWAAAQVAGMGIINRWLIVEALVSVVLAVLALRPAARALTEASGPETRAAQRRTLAYMGVVVIIAACLRLPSLGYGELYDDELDVAQSARSLLLGQTSVVFEHRKGPTEIWFAVVAAGTDSQFDEWTLRLPFVLASLGAIAGTMLLGEEFLGTRRGLLAGLLLAGEGIFLAFSRMAQYQGLVLCMIVLTAWCALRFWRATSRQTETFYLAAGALFWSFGTLTHWDGALAALFLVYAVWQKWGVTGPAGGIAERLQRFVATARAQWIKLSVIVVSALLLPAVFYLQLFLSPKVTNLKQYAGERIGFGIYNGAPGFMLHATFYDASPFILGVLLVAWLSLAWPLPRRAQPAAALLALPFAWPGFLAVGDFNLSFVLFLAVLLVFGKTLWRKTITGIVWLWLFAYFIIYAFILRSAGLHFYTLMPALMLIVSSALPIGDAAEPAVGRWYRPALAVAGLLLMISWVYAFVAYLNTHPEYALDYPRTALSIFPTFYRERPRDFFFGFPYRYGWSVIGTLYQQGELRGKFATNETYLVTDWYVRDIGAAEPDAPRYYFRVDDAPRGGDVPADLDEQFHLWGEVRVHGDPRIRIYESNRYSPVAQRLFDAERYPPTDPKLLARSMLYRQAKGDDNAFRDLGRYLDETLRDGDVLVLDTPLQDGIVPYYYSGKARITAAQTESGLANAIAGAPVIYASLFSPSLGENWLAQNAFPLESRWFGSVRLVTYAPPDPNRKLQSANVRFGDTIQLVSYSIVASEWHAGDAVRLGLEWQADAVVPTRYKVFVHVTDVQGKVVAQQDTEPMGDLAPTTTWTPGNAITDLHGLRLPATLASQPLTIAVGLYDAATNERLTVHNAQEQTLPDREFIIGGVSVR
jgi:hypothetical protein